ncbi:transglutaminase domain-containing protein [Bacillus alkalicellulosilyticus]|uniref:transglutaminase domain-containing protein n=1 Tax=Alkalihalobacterium alkalicellulosilyticum TaxID=1912214 RepID=UPI000998D477|nr:transglutaminase domain-containing protein [Bacillus alkalicellulosilyticus]
MFGYLPEFKSYYKQLVKYAEFEPTTSGDMVNFTYRTENSEELFQLRQKYDLKKVAGDGDEVSQILNLMQWVSEKLEHGDEMVPEPCHALHVLDKVERESGKVNCYTIATVLQEVYLSMGFCSRRVHCRPYDAYDQDSHVVTLVYSTTLQKWLYMDASWGTFITNKNGELISLTEFRSHLANDLEVRINGDEQSSEWSEYYTGYMAKNLFWFMTPMESKYNYEVVEKNKTYAVLLPKYYEPFEVREGKQKYHVMRNEEMFWSSPYILQGGRK